VGNNGNFIGTKAPYESFRYPIQSNDTFYGQASTSLLEIRVRSWKLNFHSTVPVGFQPLLSRINQSLLPPQEHRFPY
jgi:hypothetical protein